MKQNFAAIALGGTGQVGGAAVAELLAIPKCREVVIVTRKPIAGRSRVRNVAPFIGHIVCYGSVRRDSRSRGIQRNCKDLFFASEGQVKKQPEVICHLAQLSQLRTILSEI